MTEVTLREAAEQLGYALRSLITYRSSKSDFPAHIGTRGTERLYDLDELRAFLGPRGFRRRRTPSSADDGTAVTCLECGNTFQTLPQHLRVHGMTSAEYRTRHGLDPATPLRSTHARARHADGLQAGGSTAMRNARRDSIDARMRALGYRGRDDAITSTLHLSVKDAADRLGVATSTLARWRRNLSGVTAPQVSRRDAKWLVGLAEYAATRIGDTPQSDRVDQWISKQRHAAEAGELPLARMRTLDAFCPGWRTTGIRRAERFGARLTELGEFLSQHDGRFPRRERTDNPAERSLGEWLWKLRRAARGADAGIDLTPERIAMLNQVAPGWDTPPRGRSSQWRERH